MNYEEFLKQKEQRAQPSGIKALPFNDHLFDFQKAIVERALANGRDGVFAECGLGKTIMQLEWAHQIITQTKGRALVLTPLAVAAQTIREAQKFGIAASRKNDSDIFVTNYDQIDNIDTSEFDAVVLDEGSILKNFDGKTKQKLVSSFANTPYKISCSATPSPNDPMELGNQAEFLNVMSRNEMLAMYFVHDGGETAKWRLKKHGVYPFYKWVSTWATIISKPSDLGFDDGDFVLPPLNIIEKKIETENKGLSLFNDLAVSATEFNKELRLTISERLTEAAYISDGDEQFIIWVKQDVEADYLKDLIPDAVEVRGSESNESKEEKLFGFANKEYRVLITKPKIGMYGLNFQNCHNQIFPSPDFSFESLYQCIRRSYRFRQEHEVNIHILVTDTMQNVISSLKRKEQQWAEMINNMTQIQRTSATAIRWS